MNRSAMTWVLVIATSLGCKPPECTIDSDCTDPTKWFCTVRGQCVGCDTDEQCAEGFLCEATACTAGCRSQTDRCTWPLTCRPGQLCGCEYDSTCPVLICVGQVCPVPHGGCLTHADCDGRACLQTTHTWSNYCIGCAKTDVNADTCRVGEYCRLDTATCSPGCRTDADCDGGTCTANACQ